MRSRQPLERYRGITEKSKSLLFMLREIPYVTLAFIRRTYYSSNKTPSYAREMVRVLLKFKLIEKYMLDNGVFIYYLTEFGRRAGDFFFGQGPKRDAPTRCLYYAIPPRKPSEQNNFFFCPTRSLEFYSFTPYYIHSHPFEHSMALFELYIRLQKYLRFRHILWLDLVRDKKTALNLPFNPDLLLTNDLSTDANRIYIELENSRISSHGLLDKINNITTVPAVSYLYLCTSESVFLNFGRLIRKIVVGELKVKGRPLFFMVRAQEALSKNIWIGLWEPIGPTGKSKQQIWELVLYRYDHEIFDPEIWVKKSDVRGIGVLDPESGIPIRTKMKTGSYNRKPGERQKVMGTILDSGREQMKKHLDSIPVVGAVPSKPEEKQRNVT